MSGPGSKRDDENQSKHEQVILEENSKHEESQIAAGEQRDSQTKSKTGDEALPPTATPAPTAATPAPKRKSTKTLDPDTLAFLNNYPTFKKNLVIPAIDIVLMMLTPMKMCFTNYQWSLFRLLKKSRGKILRELEIGPLLKTIRDTKNMTLSYEK